MTKQVRLRRGTTAQVDAFTGAVGEIVIDTDRGEIRVQNGVAAGLRVPRFGGDYTSANLAYTGTLTGSTGVVNIGSGQIFKDALGNVGIGTVIPQYDIDLVRSTENPTIAIRAAAATAFNPILFLEASGTNSGYLTYSRARQSLVLGNGGLDRFEIDSAGNAGLGTTAENDARLTSKADSGVCRYGLLVNTDYVGSGISGSIYGAYIQSGGSNTATTLYGVYGDTPAAGSGKVSYGGFFKSGGSASVATYGCYGESTQPDTNGPGVAHGVYGRATSAGINNLGVTWAGYFENASATGLTANGMGVSTVSGAATVYGIRYLHNAAVCFQVLSSGNVQNTSNSYGAISDLRYKENISDAPSYIQRFMNVRFVNFNFKSETGYEMHKQLGVIAQEFEQQFPSIVHESPDLDEDGEPTGTSTKSVIYSVLSLIQGKVIQEQQQIIEQQQAVLADLLTRVAALEAR